jgi:hypothetical protein
VDGAQFSFKEKVMMNPSFIQGPGYTAPVPPGFAVIAGNPAVGGYCLIPPGSTPPPVSPGTVLIEAVNALQASMLLNTLYNLENPQANLINMQSLGLKAVVRMAPARQAPLANGIAHIREFDAIAMSGQPMRIMLVLLQGTMGVVKLVVGINLYRWADLLAPCLQFIAGINVSNNAHPQPGAVQAVVDSSHGQQIEFRIVNPDKTSTPFTAMPVNVGNVTVINVDRSIRVGNINGTGIVIGEHSTATVN